MADTDDADAANTTASNLPKVSSTNSSGFAAVNKPPPYNNPQSPPRSSKSPSPGPGRVNGVAAKTQSAESQPMTTTSSSSSHATSQPNGSTADPNGVSPYGTRSRNRTGSSRPNYAEDRDVDMDFEYTAKKKNAAATSSHPVPSGDAERSSGSNTRRSSNSAVPPQSSASKASTPNLPKESLPGMSSFSVNSESLSLPSAPAPSRKRKAPGSTPTTHNTTSGPVSSTTSAGRSRALPATTTASLSRVSNLLTFEKSGGLLWNNRLKADDGTVLALDDQVYLICEPPGEPYYLARIMEFLHVNNDRNLPVDSLRVNWYFRPRDIQRKVNDTRVVFASMQSDTCPITSLRGKCRVLHRSEIENLDDYRKGKDSFWYEKMFDRYIHRYYEVIPTRHVINVPLKVKKVLDERWKYVVVEIGRGKDLTSAIKSCKRCQGFCASNDSVDCAVCKNTYHMNCVRPPLMKKPARGFGWSCGPCSRRQERKLEARNTTNSDRNLEGEEEMLEEEDEDRAANANREIAAQSDSHSNRPQPPTAEQLAQSRLWPYRYLGIHCRVEDALDYDDRIYPRASSRLGPKHQATVQPWYGRPVELVKPAEIRKKYLKGGATKKETKLTKDALAAAEADKIAKENRPKWVIDEPIGYLPRGEDIPSRKMEPTALLQFRMPEVDAMSSRGSDLTRMDITIAERESLVDDYMKKAKALAQPMFNLRDFSTNFLDKALELLTASDYDTDKALGQLQKQRRRQDLKEPELTEDEIRRFEDGVARFGSELRNVSRHVGKSQQHGEIVRFYYMWKKTERGRRIWDNYEGRKGKKQVRQADTRLVDDVADNDDDSAFDNEKAAQRKRGFECKFCGSRRSPQWRRAPATAPGTTVPSDPSIKGTKDKASNLFVALCQRCAGLWRRYGIQWENIDEVAKKVAQGGGRAWKRRIDEELLMELVNANQASSIGLSNAAAAAAAAVGLEVPPNSTKQAGQDQPKKRMKTTNAEAVLQDGAQTDGVDENSKKKLVEKPPEPQLIPETPQLRLFPCAVCNHGIRDDASLVTCRYCRLTVHPNCYGITGDRLDKWLCDTCENDVRPEFSTIYECLLCSIHDSEDKEIMEPPKPTHKKKSDREKEKERLEKEMIAQATSLYVREKEEKGRPTFPRQALKPTAQRNWSHALCSVMHPSIMFGDPMNLRSAEGFASALQAASNEKDMRCKLCRIQVGALLHCEQCDAPVHPSCAQSYGYSLGLSLTPKTKNNPMKPMTLGDVTGIAETRVSCREHGEKKSIFPLYTPTTVDGEDMNALKAFAKLYKAVSHGSLTGTARRADLVQMATKTAAAAAAATQIGTVGTQRARNTSAEATALVTRNARSSPSTITVKSEEIGDGDKAVHGSPAEDGTSTKVCSKCQTAATPMWHTVEPHGLTSIRGQPRSTSASHARMNGSMEAGENPLPALNTSQTEEDIQDHPQWLCHKCYIRCLKNPPTPPKPVPEASKERPIDRKPSPPSSASIEPAIAPSNPPANTNVPPPWQSANASTPKPTNATIHWPSPTELPHLSYPNMDKISNGVPATSPAAPPPLALPYIQPPPPPPPPPPPSQPAHQTYHSQGSAYPLPPYPYRDERSFSYRPSQPATPHQPNGYPPSRNEPMSFQYRRDASGHMITVPYVAQSGSRPPSAHLPSPAPPQSSPPPAQHIRSPPTHIRSSSFHEQGPHGPPEADSNPFAVPQGRSAHTSPPPPPPPPYQNNNTFSPTQRPRPETPSANDRDSRWSTEAPVQTPASASPSVRNLLH